MSGALRVLESPEDVLELMDTGAQGVVALVHDAGATFLAPIFHELTGVLCTGGTPRSHIGIVEPRVPGAVRDGLHASRTASRRRVAVVEVDCSSADGEPGVVRG